MRKEQIRRLPVMDNDRHLVGIISLGDLAVKSDMARAVAALELLRAGRARPFEGSQCHRLRDPT